MSTKSKRERVVQHCGICGSDDRPLCHIETPDYNGWLCGVCLSERWPGLVKQVPEVKQFVESAKCS